MKKIYEMMVTVANRDFRALPGTRRKLVMCSVFLLVFLFAETRVSAATVNVSSLAALQSAINSAAPGDTIILANGSYTSSVPIAITCVGASSEPILIRAQSIGGVTISGAGGFSFTSPAAYVTVQGFHLTHAGDQLVIDVGTSHCRLTRNIIECTISTNAQASYVQIKGDDVEIDHNELRNKLSVGNGLDISGDSSTWQVARRLWVHHNYFHDFNSPNGANGGETIRWGLGNFCASSGDGIMEYNLMDRCNGEGAEMLSNKSCNNTYRYNTFLNTTTNTFKIRQGTNCLVYGNSFSNTLGLVIYGPGHKIYNNYFINCLAAIQIGSGDTNIFSPGNGHNMPDGCVIAFNTLINNTLQYWMNPSGNYIYGATNITFANNIIAGAAPAANLQGGPYYNGVWTSNIIWNTTFGNTSPGDIPSGGYTKTNPLVIVTNTYGVLHIASNSPAIGAAASGYTYVTNDMDGQSRPDTGKDIGADQFSSAPVAAHFLTASEVGPFSDPVSVTLTSPSDGSAFILPTSINLTADASSITGTITRVDFFYGSTNLIGSDTTAPYTYTWTNVVAGSYSLTAQATDNSGATGISKASGIQVLASTINVTNFSASGAWTWTCPANVTSVLVECWGAGGAGGSAQGTSGGTPQYGGGGAGGVYARYNSYPVTAGHTYYIDVGAGGYNNFLDNDTTVPGGDSWFNTNNAPSPVIIAKGGAGGESAIGSTTATGYGLGGAGTATGSAGNIVHAGGSGATGASGSAGGGGSSGGTNSAGTSATSSVGATAPAGGGNGGTGPTTNDAAGGNGFVPGGGGSGGRSSSVFLKAGGSGSPGQVILTYVVNIPPIVSLTAPASGASFTAPASIVLTANAADPDGTITSVAFHNGPTLLGTDTNAPYAYTWTNVTVGSYNLTAVATGNDGLVRTSTVATISVLAPTYALTVSGGTGSGSYTNGKVVAISADAPASGKAFDQWIGDTQYVNNVTYTNALVTMSTNSVSLIATYKNTYVLTVSGGSGSGSYLYQQQVPISANAPATGKIFDRWTGNTQYVNNVTYTNALVTMPTNAITLTAAYNNLPGWYTLTVSNGTGSGTYTNTQVVAIAGNIPATGTVFVGWTGTTQYVNNVTNINTFVTMSTNTVSLTATYSNLYYALTVNGGTGSGSYVYHQQVTVTATNPPGMVFDRWIGDTQVVAGASSLSSIVTMPTNPVSLTATFSAASNGVVNVSWGASGGFYFRANPGAGILAPTGSGKSTIARLMYSPNNIKDNILPSGAGLVNDVVWDTITITENGDGLTEWAVISPPHSTVRAWTNGYVYALIFQDNNVQPGDWYYSTPLVALVELATNAAPQSIEMNTDTMLGDAVDGTNGAQVITGIVLTVNSGSGSGTYTNGQQVAISPSDLRSGVTFKAWIGDAQYVNNVTYTNALVTMSTNPVTLTATYYYNLTVTNGIGGGSYTNGQRVTITASNAPITGKTFSQWIGDTQYVASVTSSPTTVILSTNPATLTATYVDITYALTVNDGTGGGLYTNRQQVAIAASNAPAGMVFVSWLGGTTQVVANVTNSNTTVTMPTNAVTLTATYGYVLTVFGGNGGGSYTNGTQVAITAQAPAPGKIFSQWTGSGTQYVANVTATNITLTMPATDITVRATFKDITYPLTINSGNGSGSYTNGQQVAISPSNLTGAVFIQWTGNTQYVDSVTSSNAVVTMSTNPVTLTATYYYVYTLTVNGGTIDGGGGPYTNGTQVAITANPPAPNTTFDRWTGDTQTVNNVTYTNALVTIPARNVTLTATYKNLPGYYTLTVSNGTGSGAYTNGTQVPITAVAPDATAFDRWIGDTQYVDRVFTSNAIVTMPAQNVALTAACADASNGVVSVGWGAGAGFYFSADGSPVLGPTGSGKSTIVQLMYSPDDVKDDILPSGIGMVNDVVWDAITITENGDGVTEWAQMLSRVSTVRTWTTGYVYAVTFQKSDVQPGDWYFFSSPMLALEKKQVGDAAQDLEMNTDTVNGDPIDGGPNNAQVIGAVLLTASAGAHGTISPPNVYVQPGSNATFVITASNYYRIATLTTNGTAVTGMSFNNGSTATNFTWSNVQTSGVLAATFTAQVATDPTGTPYWWLAQYGLTNYNTDAAADQDGDGLTAGQEYIAGTDPINAASCLRVAQNIRNSITWSPVTGRIYSVYWSTNLMKGFSPLSTNILPPQSSYTNTTPDARLNHYQVKVRLQ